MNADGPNFVPHRPHRGEARFWDQQLRDGIGQDLRAIFENSVKEPLPERISRVLERVEAKSGAGRVGSNPDRG